MNSHDALTPVGELVANHPGLARVFERMGIDYCCGGKTPLVDACAQRGFDLNQVLHHLDTVEAGTEKPEVDWTTAPLTALVDNIVTTHHAYLRQELPRLLGLFEKVVGAHGQGHPELLQARDVFEGLRSELMLHMLKEEKVLFPMIRQLESDRNGPEFFQFSMVSPVHVMEHEHEVAGAALARLRELTGDYTPPPEACLTYRALLAGLEELESDLHRHIHKENNILFPRATAAEAALFCRDDQAQAG